VYRFFATIPLQATERSGALLKNIRAAGFDRGCVKTKNVNSRKCAASKFSKELQPVVHLYRSLVIACLQPLNVRFIPWQRKTAVENIL
jgi:hypothetical protein